MQNTQYLALTTPSNNSTINTLRPLLTGTAAANATVKVYQQGGVPYFGAATADADGLWSLQLNQDLTLKENQSILSLTQDDYVTYTPITLYVNLAHTTPTQPSTGILALTTPSNNSTINTRQPLLRGTAAAYASVWIYQRGDGTPFATLSADHNGAWSYQVTRDLAVNNGQTLLSLTQDRGGTWTDITLNMNVSTPPANGGLPSGSNPILTSPTTVNSLRPLLTGRAAANAIVYVYLAGGSILYGTPQADANGDWQLQLNQDLYSNAPTPLSLGEHNANGGLVSGWTQVTLTVNSAPASNALPSGTTPIVSTPSAGSTQSSRPTFSGLASAYATVNVFQSYGGIIATTQADGQGIWSVQSSNELAGAAYDNNSYSFAVQQVSNGVTSAYSENQKFYISLNTVPAPRPGVLSFNGTPDPEQELFRVGNKWLVSDRQPTGFYLPPDVKLVLNCNLFNNPNNAPPSLSIGAPNTHPLAQYATPRTYPLHEGENIVKDPGGGLIYFKMTGVDSIANIEFKSGMFPAPFFRYGETTPEQYHQMLITFTQSPQVELSSPRALVTVSREAALAYQNTNPNELMETYEKIITVEETLIGLDGSKEIHSRPPLIYQLCQDLSSQDLSTRLWAYSSHYFTGYSHSALQDLLDPQALKKSWGIPHEIGHTNQMLGYFIEEMGEVTNNIASLTVERYFGNPSTLLNKGHDGLSTWDTALSKVSLPGLSYADLEVFERLIPFEQLRLAFGEVFLIRLNQITREKSQSNGYSPERSKALDNLVLFASLAASTDLRDFFSTWGLGASEQGRQAVAALNLPLPNRDLFSLREYG